MDANRTAVVLTKLAAVFIAVLALRDLSQFVFFYVGSTASSAPVLSALGLQFLIPIAIAFLLWRFPSLVVGSMANSTTNVSAGSDSAEMLLLIGVSLLGLYTLVFGVVDLVYFEAHRYAQRELAEAANMDFYGDSPDNVAGRIANLCQIAFGVTLIFGRRRLSKFLLRIRSAGTGAN